MSKKRTKTYKPTPKKNLSVTQTSASFYSGKLPPPEMMQQYNQIDHSFADRIIQMAEREATHVHKIENRKLTISTIISIFGMLAGLLALAGMLYILYVAIDKDKTFVAFWIIGIMVGIVSLFIVNKKLKKKNNNQKRN